MVCQMFFHTISSFFNFKEVFLNPPYHILLFVYTPRVEKSLVFNPRDDSARMLLVLICDTYHQALASLAPLHAMLCLRWWFLCWGCCSGYFIVFLPSLHSLRKIHLKLQFNPFLRLNLCSHFSRLRTIQHRWITQFLFWKPLSFQVRTFSPSNVLFKGGFPLAVLSHNQTSLSRRGTWQSDKSCPILSLKQQMKIWSALLLVQPAHHRSSLLPFVEW